MNETKNMAEVDQMIQEASEKYDFVRFVFSDIHGLARCKIVAKHSFERLFRSGVETFAGAIAFSHSSAVTVLDAVTRLNYGNCVMRPVPGTLRAVTWSSEKTSRVGQVLCEPHWTETGRPQEAGPRYLARKALKRLEDHGYRLFSAFEIEFTVTDKKDDTPLIGERDFLLCSVLHHVEPLLLDLSRKMEGTGIGMETLQTEYSIGQLELTTTPEYDLVTADNLFVARDCIRGVCESHDKNAIFMTRGILDAASSGFHFNHSLYTIDGLKPVFGDPSAEDKMSRIGRYWLGGMMAHTNALCALCAPTINCYRRFHNPWAPEVNSWNIGDRFASYRFKNSNPESTYWECRLPSSACNPYIVVAAVIAAGLDGVERQLEPPPPGTDHGPAPVPFSLPEALDALEKDTVLIDAIGKEFVEWFVKCKRDHEVSAMKKFLDTNTMDSKEAFEEEKKMYLRYI